jgi:hypothetical protein
MQETHVKVWLNKSVNNLHAYFTDNQDSYFGEIKAFTDMMP